MIIMHEIYMECPFYGQDKAPVYQMSGDDMCLLNASELNSIAIGTQPYAYFQYG